MWHATHDRWREVNILSKFYVSSFYDWEWGCSEDIFDDDVDDDDDDDDDDVDDDDDDDGYCSPLNAHLGLGARCTGAAARDTGSSLWLRPGIGRWGLE